MHSRACGGRGAGLLRPSVVHLQLSVSGPTNRTGRWAQQGCVRTLLARPQPVSHCRDVTGYAGASLAPKLIPVCAATGCPQGPPPGCGRNIVGAPLPRIFIWRWPPYSKWWDWTNKLGTDYFAVHS